MMFHRLCTTIAIFCSISCILRADDSPRWQTTISIGSHSETRSEIIEVDRGETISVLHPIGRGIEVYVHNEAKLLLAKEEDLRSERFRFQAPEKDHLYVFARNLLDLPVVLKIEVYSALPFGEHRTVLPDSAVVKVYYAADRALTGDPDDPFGTDPAPDGSISYGLCNVIIPRNHKMGELEGPSIWRLEFRPDADKHISIVGRPVIAASHAAFFNQLKQEFGFEQSKPALVFVHGFATEFLEAARRTAQLNYDLGLGTVPILYSWATKGTISPFAYNHDVRNADLTAMRLQRFLIDLSQRAGVQSIFVIAHSMGNRVLSRALADMGAAQIKSHLQQVALLAPDIDANLFRQLSVRMRSSVGKIALYASSRDAALMASELWSSYPRAGQGGEKVVVVPGIDTIDATNVDVDWLGLFHGYYADSRSVIGDLYEFFRGSPPSRRHGLFQMSRDGAQYWAFKQ
jgi:esterase/lipase superfamily enzyme